MGRVRFLSHPAAPYLLNAEERQGSIVLQLNLRHVFLLAVCCYNSATNLAQSWRINSGFVTKHMVRYYLVFSTCLPVKYETKYLPWRKFKHCTLYLPPVFSLTVPDGKRRESFAQLHGNAVKFQLFIVVVLTDKSRGQREALPRPLCHRVRKLPFSLALYTPPMSSFLNTISIDPQAFLTQTTAQFKVALCVCVVFFLLL